ncbi:MAG: AfsR/SARP family transcriptional regulator [Nocardioides sp.]
MQATLQLLGWWDLRRGEDSIPLGRREQRLVALIALTGRRTRDQLAGMLWPESSEHHALSSLRAAVWNTRRAAGDVLLVQQHTLALAGDLTVDVTQLVGFASGVTAAPGAHDSPEVVESLESADLLPGWYDDWVLFERERVDHVRFHALEALARARLRAGRPYEAADAARSALRIEPLHEGANVLMIRSCLVAGSTVEAVRHFHDYRRRLEHDLGIRPSAQLRELVGPLLVPHQRGHGQASRGLT